MILMENKNNCRNINSGEVIEEDKSLNSGKQCSAIIWHLDALPKISFNQKTKQLAIAMGDTIEVLTP